LFVTTLQEYVTPGFRFLTVMGELVPVAVCVVCPTAEQVALYPVKALLPVLVGAEKIKTALRGNDDATATLVGANAVPGVTTFEADDQRLSPSDVRVNELQVYERPLTNPETIRLV
jgi:hypothetical protein